MERINLYEIYCLAGVCGRIPVLAPGRAVTVGLLGFFVNAAEHLIAFEHQWAKPYKLCEAEVRAVQERLTAVMKHNQLGDNLGADLEHLQAAFLRFQTALEHHLPNVRAYRVTKPRGYDSEVLLENAEKCVSDRAQALLSEHLLDNWREAGRCLALKAPTASAFHVLRVAEAYIRKYYKATTGNSLEGGMSLVDYITELKKAGADARVMLVLNQLRAIYRNKTMHPGPVVSMDRASSLFGLGVSILDEIAEQIEEEKRKATARERRKKAKGKS